MEERNVPVAMLMSQCDLEENNIYKTKIEFISNIFHYWYTYADIIIRLHCV